MRGAQVTEEIEARTKEIIDRDSFAEHIGARLLDIRQGWAKVGLKLNDNHLNFLGMIHGGVIFSLADVAFGAAANSFGSRAMALSVGIDFLAAPDITDDLSAEVELVTRAGKMGFYRMLVTDSGGKTVAQCHGWAYHTGKPLEEDT
jgi:acyl-CoA thioesterase